MTLEFSGPATPIDGRAIGRAALRIGCQVAAIRAVIDVESRGGFLADKRPRILFERHYFSRLTKRRFDAAHPDLADPRPGGYRGGTAEYLRLHRAIALDRAAALQSASWGAFQIMGANHARCGFADVEAFVAAMVSGEPAQLDAFVEFIKRSGLDQPLIRLDWPVFARGYNGPAFARNRYPQKLEAAYRRHSAPPPSPVPQRPLLRPGDRGEAVKQLQRRLNLTEDGRFGPATRAGVIAFQKRHGLLPDGIVGRESWRKLDPG